MKECFMYVFNLLNNNVLYMTLLLGGIGYFLSFLTVLFFRRFGYLNSVKKAIRKTRRFIDKYLIINEKNLDKFYDSCICYMPLPVKNSWRIVCENKLQNAGDGISQELYRRKNAEYKNDLIMIYFRLTCLFLTVGSVIALYIFKYELPIIAGVTILYFLAYYILSNIYLAIRYLSELTYDSDVDDIISQLNRFVRFKPLNS